MSSGRRGGVLVVTLGVLGCGDVEERPDGGRVDAAVTADADMSLPPFGNVTALTINDPVANDDDPSLTADQLELFFVSDRMGTLGSGDIFVSTRTSTTSAWGIPMLVTALNSAAEETHPEVSPDGLTMYFGSSRAGGPQGYDIYVSARATRTGPWSAPSVVTELSNSANDFGAAPDPTGLMVIVDSNRNGASGRDLYVATRATPQAAWGIPVVIAPVSTPDNDYGGVLADAGRALYFSRTAPSDPASGTIHVATRPSKSDAFDAPTEVAGVNSPTAGDLDPWVSEDQRVIFFVSKRAAGNDDIYTATR